VYWILEDKFGNFWMSCNKGIFSVRKKDLRDVLNGKKNSVSCNVYGRESGMKSVQCSGAFSQAGAHFLDKYMIFPTTGGAVIVNPDPKNFIIRPPVANIENIIYKQKSRSIDEKEQIFELDDPEEVAEVQFSALSFSHPEKVQFRYTLKGLNKGLINLGKTRVIYLSNLPYGEYELFVQASTDGIKWMGSAKKVIFRVPPPFWFNPLFWLSSALTIVLMVWLLVRWRINRLHKAKIHLEELVDKKTLELRKEKETVEQQYEELTQKSQVILQKNTIIEEQNHNLKDSLRYAKRIQEAILPTESNLQTYFPFSWLYYRPRDIVSGDFYWLSKKKLTFNGKEENWLFFAVGDCTGHGVPGALMTVMGSTMLSEIADDMVSPEHLHIGLSLLDSKIHAMLQKNKESDSRTNDGMDIALFAVNAEAKKLFFSSAKLPFFHVRNGFLTEIKGNRFPIGSSALYDDDKNFVTEEIDLEKGDQIFVLSDGFQDQFGGEYFKKFTKKRLKTRLTELCAVDFFEQKKTLKHNFEEWKGENEQTDDVIALSVRF
jgi:serine phosphatase RsbU (regulator of sigma subunit)